MAPPGGRRPIALEVQVRSHASACGICGWNSRIRTGFSPRTSVSRAGIIPLMLCNCNRVGPRHVGADIELFRPRTKLAKFLRARAQIAYNLRKNSVACANLSFPGLYFCLFQ
jgi:hypothetical protein